MDLNKYASFSLKDFLEDDDFVNSIINTSKEDSLFFAEMLLHYPEKKEDIETAESLIHNYRKQDTFLNEDRQAEVWKRIEAEARPVKQAKVFSLLKLMRVAAAVLVVGLGAFTFWYNQQQNFSTTFGEIKTVVMPDGTTVLLNGNSSLSYQRGFGKNPREVWLKGEGLFKVIHLNKNPANIKPAERFIVHCNDLNIEVLGTTFNVNNRHNKINVGLITGKIKVTANNVKKAAPSLILAPGDYVEYATKKVVLKGKLAHPERLANWSKRQFVFANEKLKNILKTLEDTYGYQIKYTNAAAMDMEIEGEINVTGVKELLETISASLHVSIYQNENQIIIN
ncbi:FecR family protein [Mucilaginibacter phyllosphaerae]|uniref:FecR family protein n=1 Tax=Mucilaginibacter phyllosphaerae TaxID=1812349 RepID=A0A4Y8A674_9SPHI|nr:FecR family protein [Mucilaginibacter phyllosphaerae]MBB3971144.1 ferric-dicitrate binding protein FerR (iron transport regulator) [Mucilaginibacter phyllosphaerae]TEW63870.1 FecR family protein [Mucilaginibacter phyllosphaerae]GGH22731.1 anti-sigma factor [Mucilaginibacter phyllosphaerae]